MQFTIQHFGSVTSTNDLAVEMARDGAPEGTVIVAREQTAGRGRLGRRWISPKDSGLYLSIILTPDMPASGGSWELSFVASLAAAEAIRRVSGLPARIKWPNDVLLGGRKVCGILVETRQTRGHLPSYAIIGIGINTNASKLPPEIAETATSIALELGRAVQPPELERVLLEALDTRYSEFLREGFSSILSAWKELDCTLGQRLTVHAADRIIEGTAVGIDAQGSLLIERPDGTRSNVTAGEVLLDPLA